VLALDKSCLDDALGLATTLRPWFSCVKVGLELFAAEGPLAVDALLDEGFSVFLDLKLYDIPTTVHHAARRIGSMGVSYATVHACGGEEMVRAAVEGFEEGWALAVANGHSVPPPGSVGILAVTVLTSESDASAGLITSRSALAAETGCLGVVCATADLPVVTLSAPGLLRVVPGIRLEGSERDDQSRSGGPFAAIRAGADLLVVGRTVTSCEDPKGPARQVLDQVLAATRPDSSSRGH
jgi:orotidine-5'-phosphate decarboxylase